MTAVVNAVLKAGTVAESVDTSIIVLTYRRVPALLAVLRALAMQCDARCEIIVADDGSPRETLDALVEFVAGQARRFQCKLSHVWHPDTGFTASRARNLGARVASGKRLIFIDGDCVPNARFVAMHRALERPGEFVNGSRVLLNFALTQKAEQGAVDLLAASFGQWLAWRRSGAVNKLLHLFPWLACPGRVDKHFRWKAIRSCNFAVWRDDFVVVNGFDESFEGWGHEDADLVLRLHNAGLTRRNGFLATEVFHLWHREQNRTQADKNYQMVSARLKSRQVVADVGLREGTAWAQTVVTALN
jgi:GT2 family glycosyltransferase